MTKTAVFSVSGFLRFCKKNRENVAINFFQFIIDSDGKKPLRIAILEFYKLNLNKRKEYTVKHFKKVLPGLKSKDGLKSLKPLEIAIKNLDREPEKQLI